METKSTQHAVYNINYHIVWISKYRKKILTVQREAYLRRVLSDVAVRYGVDILGMEIMQDHVHLFVSAPPRCSPADLVKKFKGISGSLMFQEFPELRTVLRKGKVWTRSYYVGTAGTVTAETIRKYIDEQKTKQENS